MALLVLTRLFEVLVDSSKYKREHGKTLNYKLYMSRNQGSEGCSMWLLGNLTSKDYSSSVQDSVVSHAEHLPTPQFEILHWACG